MVILTPFILFNFCLDYLSDSEITHSETKIGMYQLLHHIVATIWTGVFTLPFMSSRLPVVSLSILISMIIQIGHRINKDYCWLTRHVNCIINPDKPKRKWVGGDIGSLMKKYIRDPEWAYTDMRPPKNDILINIMNSIHLIILIKIIFFLK